MKYLAIILTFLISLVAGQDDNPCVDYIQQVFQYIITKNQTGIAQTVLPYVVLSGKFLQDLGDFNQCKRNTKNQYFLMDVNMPNQQGQIGICFTGICSANDLNENKESIINIIQVIYMGLKLNITIEEYAQYISFSSPTTDYPSNEDGMDLTITLLCIITAISFIIPIYQFFRPAPKGQDEEEESQQQSLINENQRELALSQMPMFFRLLHCFSFSSNFSKLTRFSKHSQPTDVLNCFRAISFCWAFLGAEYLAYKQYSYNKYSLQTVAESTNMTIIFASDFSIDVFLMLGGFLLAYQLMDPLIAHKFTINKPCMAIQQIFKRLLRIWPAYFFAVLIYWTIVPYSGDGPIWPHMNQVVNKCDKYWIRDLTFTNNFGSNPPQACVSWGYYLSLDMQFYIISIFLVMLLNSHKKLGYLIILNLLFLFLIVNLSITESYSLIPMVVLNGWGDYFQYFYFYPWTRIMPYIIGILFGAVIRDESKLQSLKTRFGIMKAYLFYAIGLAIISFFVWIPRTMQVNGSNSWPGWIAAFWVSFQKPGYVVGVIFMIIPGLLGSKDLISSFMKSSIFAFMARISFSGYLLFGSFIAANLFSVRAFPYIDTETMFYIFFTDLILVTLSSILFTVVIEKSFRNLICLCSQPVQRQIINEPYMKIDESEPKKINVSLQNTDEEDENRGSKASIANGNGATTIQKNANLGNQDL